MVFNILCFYKLNVFTPFIIVSRIYYKLVQQYGRLKLVTMEMEKLYSEDYNEILDYREAQ